MILFKNQSNWYGISKCINCHKQISIHQIAYSRGVCPRCGYDSKSTVCNYYNTIIRRNIVIQLNSNFPYIHIYVDIEKQELK